MFYLSLLSSIDMRLEYNRLMLQFPVFYLKSNVRSLQKTICFFLTFLYFEHTNKIETEKTKLIYLF